MYSQRQGGISHARAARRRYNNKPYIDKFRQYFEGHLNPEPNQWFIPIITTTIVNEHGLKWENELDTKAGDILWYLVDSNNRRATGKRFKSHEIRDWDEFGNKP